MLTFLMRSVSTPQDLKLFWLLLNLCCCVTAWPQADDCPSSEWSAMCRPCCEYHLIQCQCPSKGSKVGYTVPCCRNALDQCDPCIIHPGCSLFENCKTCHNGTWKANDNFFVNGKYCTECRQGWSGGDCKTCGGVIQRAQGHIAMESYPTNARCEWTVRVERDSSIELRFSQLSLEPDHNCRYDYVEVRDGDDLSSPVIGRYCGDQLPPPIRSSGNLLHILFSSDGYNNLDGFVLTFQESPGQTSRVRCSPPPTLLNGHHRPAPDTAGGAETIEFSCKKPYILSGNQRSTCLSNGSWSSRPPKCVRACREPKISELVRQSVVRPLLRSRLDKQLKTDDDDAFMDLPRGFHPVHTTIEYKCASMLYRHTGSSQRTCLKSGRWSGRHVSCSPVCGKFDISSPHNHTDTPWPWHAAVYIRSSPDQTASTHQPRGLVMSIQQGASEQSTFWYLACSGALLSQRGVLVAAQCVVNKDNEQTLHPAHVKVVIGMPSQISKGRLKSLPQLRVSDILVHPKFDSSPDAHVAVLKLKDKARISEHVLPVCLPKVQGGEVTVQEAHTARWISPNDHILHPIRHTPSSQTRLVELVDIAQCEREFAQGRAYTAAISDNTLCVIRKPSSPESLCPNAVPGITTVPAYTSGHGETQEASSAHWQLLSLESFSQKEENCHQQTYTVQTSIANFRDWIENNIK